MAIETMRVLSLSGSKRKSLWIQDPREPSSAPSSKNPHLEDIVPASLPINTRAEASGYIMGTSEEMESRFHVTSAVLGSGQFGTVRECIDKRTGERLACKSMKRRTGWGASQVEEIRTEAALMAEVSGHQGVVQLKGLFEGENEIHMVMELCEGGDLFDQVIERERFQEKDAAHVFSQLVTAVAVCHSHGIVHRDLKPENVLICKGRNSSLGGTPADTRLRVKLADFGLATTLKAGEKLRGIAGSPFYMAPEVLRGEYGSEADVWSLGVILYILLTGTPPFWGEGDDEIFAAIEDGHVDFSSQPWGCISTEAKGLISSMLNKNPRQRPTAQQVLTHSWLMQSSEVAQFLSDGAVRMQVDMTPVPSAIAV